MTCLCDPESEESRHSLAHRLSGLEEALAAKVALARVARLARPAAALSVADPRVPVAVGARALERAEHVRALAQRMAVVQFRGAALVQICGHEICDYRFARKRHWQRCTRPSREQATAVGNSRPRAAGNNNPIRSRGTGLGTSRARAFSDRPVDWGGTNIRRFEGYFFFFFGSRQPVTVAKQTRILRRSKCVCK